MQHRQITGCATLTPASIGMGVCKYCSYYYITTTTTNVITKFTTAVSFDVKSNFRGGHSTVFIKFPDFSRYFSHGYYYSQNHQTYTLQTGLCELLSEYRGTIRSQSCACQLYLTVLRLCLFHDYRNCGSKPQANQNFPDFFLISPTNVKFLDSSRFFWVDGQPAFCNIHRHTVGKVIERSL